MILINAPGIIRTIPSLQQVFVLAALHVQFRLLHLHRQPHQLVRPHPYHQLHPVLVQEQQQRIALDLPGCREQQLLFVKVRLHPNYRHPSWNHRDFHRVFPVVPPHNHPSDRNHGSAKSVTTLLVPFISVKQQLLLQPLLNVT